METKKISIVIIFLLTFLMAQQPIGPVGENWPNTEVPVEESICFALYTVNNNTLKMTAQLYPLEEDVDKTVKLQIKKNGEWETIQSKKVSEEYYGAPQEDKKEWMAHFRVENWEESKNYNYRLVAAGGKAEYKGVIRKNPMNQETIKVAAFTGNGNKNHALRPDIVNNIKEQDPDLLFFSGDQSYDHKKHQQAWLLFGEQFGEIIKNRPTVCIPDDHDVGQYNLWGEKGIKAHSQAGDDGGYYFSPEYVNSVQEAQTWHLPDPYNPEPVQRGIEVYYTSLQIGKVDFAIIEDRKFKTAPKGLVPDTLTGSRPDHIFDFDHDPDKIDFPEAKILGKRQLKFLHDWGKDWQNVNMKSVLSQTIFANVAYRSGEYDYVLAGDLDSNGWPPTARNRAIRAMRKAFALHIAGDQHLATVIHHGVNRFRDSNFSFCVPSVVNYWKRWWTPRNNPAGKPIDGPVPYLGDYYDGMDNKITMHAYANPSEKRKNKWGQWGERAPGYGLIHFNTETRKIKMECWPRGVDVSKKKAEQYKAWPITIEQRDNYGRNPIAYLPKLKVKGMKDPVVQVIYELDNTIVYTLRIEGTEIQPKVFKDGKYTVRIGEQPDKMKELTGLQAQEDMDRKKQKVIKVNF